MKHLLFPGIPCAALALHRSEIIAAATIYLLCFGAAFLLLYGLCRIVLRILL